MDRYDNGIWRVSVKLPTASTEFQSDMRIALHAWEEDFNLHHGLSRVTEFLKQTVGGQNGEKER